MSTEFEKHITQQLIIDTTRQVHTGIFEKKPYLSTAIGVVGSQLLTFETLTRSKCQYHCLCYKCSYYETIVETRLVRCQNVHHKIKLLGRNFEFGAPDKSL